MNKMAYGVEPRGIEPLNPNVKSGQPHLRGPMTPPKYCSIFSRKTKSEYSDE